MKEVSMRPHTVYETTNISGAGKSHLGDVLYGDTFQVAHIEHADFYISGPPQQYPYQSGFQAAVSFTQTAKRALDLGRQLLQFIDSSLEYVTSETCKSAIIDTRASWTRIELALQGVLSDVGSRSLAANVDTLLDFQQSCLMDIHTTISAALYKLSQLRDLHKSTLPTNASKSGGFAMERAFDSFSREIEKDIVMFEISCQLLARLSDTKPKDLTNNTEPSKVRDDPPLPLMQHIRTLVQNQFAVQYPSPTFINVMSYEVLGPLGPNTVSAWKGRSREGHGDVILNSTAYPENVPTPIIAKTVQNLAYMLSPIEVMSFGLPQCLGLIRHGPTEFCYVLCLPPNLTTPISLRSRYANDAEPSLSVKISFAKSLCRAVMFLHTANSVHKSIRPDNIIITSDSPGERRNLFLIGLEQIRAQYDHSALRSDMEWYKNIYRHPNRQGLYAQEFYLMQHDIYSLGVCLLELGLWFSFVVMQLEKESQIPIPNPKLEIDNLQQDKGRPRNIQKRFIAMARSLLPAKIGDIYTQVVLSCLTCLEGDEVNTFMDAKTIDDEAGLLVGVAFIEKVMLRLEQIVI